MSDPCPPYLHRDPAQRWVACLCADWCGTCRDYRTVFDQVAAEYPGMPFLWLDIEDQAALVGELDIETFPTLLIADGDELRFAGPLLPHAGTLSRMVGALAPGVAATSVDPALTALARTLYQNLKSA
ncbi:thioredoxin family protein [Polaromonas sp. SM01]|uniref:thioredoxin family protein n=1 Tax=Polaromonas sp. SM01 TaxID=3085630 RepID=UPI00298259E2|nr:thioredoxin family protein [Polaromonas sp. SM01]MDW5444524.1 thioredoxin family protein [Polaromonas sp. SM01]